MCAERYRPEQILRGLRHLWEERLGCETPFEPDRSLVEALQAEALWDDLDYFIDFTDLIHEHFGLSCSAACWREFLGGGADDRREWENTIASRLTFRALAEFIREQLEPVRLEPLTILGRRCAPAGVFRGIEELVRQIRPRAGRFGPSTPIRRRLRGLRLHRLWQRLRWIVPADLPPAPRITLGGRAVWSGLALKVALGGVAALLLGDMSPLLSGVVTALLLLLGVAWAVRAVNAWWISPLPAGVETFGDLAKLLAEEMGAGHPGSM